MQPTSKNTHVRRTPALRKISRKKRVWYVSAERREMVSIKVAWNYQVMAKTENSPSSSQKYRTLTKHVYNRYLSSNASHVLGLV